MTLSERLRRRRLEANLRHLGDRGVLRRHEDGGWGWPPPAVVRAEPDLDDGRVMPPRPRQAEPGADDGGPDA